MMINQPPGRGPPSQTRARPAQVAREYQNKTGMLTHRVHGNSKVVIGAS
jgi:hypothetical protein